jgi:hypothetical protein
MGLIESLVDSFDVARCPVSMREGRSLELSPLSTLSGVASMSAIVLILRSLIIILFPLRVASFQGMREMVEKQLFCSRAEYTS